MGFYDFDHPGQSPGKAEGEPPALKETFPPFQKAVNSVNKPDLVWHLQVS